MVAMALAEFGMNDEQLLADDVGGLRMEIHRVELPSGSNYFTVWEGTETVQVELYNSSFCTITNGYIQIEPGTYDNTRLTVDSLAYVQQTSTILLVDTSFAFIAQTFMPIIIEEENEYRLVISIASDVWFDADSVRIIPGRYPFEGAALRMFYRY